MNFLAHVEISPFQPGPWHFLGCIFPDLAKRAGVEFRAKEFLELGEKMPDEFRKGIALHFEGDRLFHNSPLFLSGIEVWKQVLVPENEEIRRTFFLHHLVFEMWLDRLIMEQNPLAGPALYQILEVFPSEEIKSELIRIFGLSGNKLYAVFQQFINRKFILSYSDSNAFSEIAVGVFGYITQQKQSQLKPGEIIKALEAARPFSAQILENWETFKGNFRL